MRIFRLFNKFEPLGHLGIDFYALHSVGHLVSWNEFINSFIEQDRVYFWNDDLFESFDNTNNYEIYDLIFVNFHHTNTCNSDEDEFIFLQDFLDSNNPKKIAINCYLAFKDPQEVIISSYKTMIYKSNAFDLYDPNHFQELREYNKRILDNNYLSIDATVNKFEKTNVLIFHLALSANSWRKIDRKKNFLSFFKSPSISLAEKKANNSKDTDIVITGETLPFIYPFRFNAINNIKHALASEFKTQSNNTICTDFFHKARQVYFEAINDYYNALSRSKVGVACSSIYGYPLGKYFEMMANGVIVIADSPIDNEDIGLIPGVNFLESTVQGINDKVLDVLTNYQKYIKIKENALEYVNSVYNARSNATLVLKEIEEVLTNL